MIEAATADIFQNKPNRAGFTVVTIVSDSSSPKAASIFWAAVFLRMLSRDLLSGNAQLVRSYWRALVHGFSRRQPPPYDRKPGGKLVPPTSPASSTHQG